jgi:hypothetical protein
MDGCGGLVAVTRVLSLGSCCSLLQQQQQSVVGGSVGRLLRSPPVILSAPRGLHFAIISKELDQ